MNNKETKEKYFIISIDKEESFIREFDNLEQLKKFIGKFPYPMMFTYIKGTEVDLY